MSRRPGLAFEAISIQGGLLTADFLARVANLQASSQQPAAYRLPKGLQVRDEIGRAWRIAVAHMADVDRAAGRQAQERILTALLRDAFGWVSLEELDEPLEIEGRLFPISGRAVNGRVPLVLGELDSDLDVPLERFGEQRRRSAFGLLQECLNADDGVLWGVVTNGRVLRLVRDNVSLTRPAWIEVDLGRIVAEERYADFSLLWLLLHESRFGASGGAPEDAPLEAWRRKALEDGTAARERLRDGVEVALRVLGNGFLAHPGNGPLRQRLTAGDLETTEYQQQLLRLVYRMIFLVVVEDRGLLHPPGSDQGAVEAYRVGYSLSRLRDRAVRRRAWDRHDDAWDVLRVVFAGCASGESRLALPGLGGLFAAGQCPDLDRARLPNAALLEAVFRLTWLADDGAVIRINWRDMGTEELGSVYESLLELEPELLHGATGFRFHGEEGGGAGGNVRRLTGSYYTPDSLVQALLDTALDPVIQRTLGAEDPERALLSLAILDPAMGSGHFLLGAARRIADQLAKLRSDGPPSPAALRSALRDVITHCVHGVDKNPMAVELARIALWLEAMEPGKPLAFLDHHLVHGDALLGVHSPGLLMKGIPDEAFKPLTGDDADVCRELKKQNSKARKALDRERKGGQFRFGFNQEDWAETLATAERLPDGTLEEVAAKSRAVEAARSAMDERFRLACDMFVAAFLQPKTERTAALVPTTGVLRNLVDGIEPPKALRDAVEGVSAETPFLHWPLTFGRVMARGGFDCVIGNPPWERIKLSEKEYFATRAPEIAAAPNRAARQELIEELEMAAPGTLQHRLFRAFQRAKREAEGGSTFMRQAGRFPLTGQGDVNLYALFAEASLQLRHHEGRAGLVLPSGIATDAGTAEFFRHVADGQLVSLIDFENREALFAGVHRSYKFCLFTIGHARAPSFAFFLTQAEQRFDERRRFTLSPADLRRLNPNTGTAPIFRSRADAELTAKIYRNVPVLWDETREDGNPWGLSFGTLFHMSNDSHLFETSPGRGLVPLYEAKMIHQFDHRFASFTSEDEERARLVTEEEKSDPNFQVRPRYWVPKSEVKDRLRAKGWDRPWLMGWRRIVRVTDARTLIACLMPFAGVGDSIFLMFPSSGRPERIYLGLLGVLNSLVCDYAARQKIGGTNASFYYMRQLPVPPPSVLSSNAGEAIIKKVEQLTALSLAGSTRAVAVGRLAPHAIAPSVIRAEVDALVALLYGLDRDDLAFIADPASALGEEYPTETFRVLKEAEQRDYGEFRTRRLVLEAWDRLIGSR